MKLTNNRFIKLLAIVFLFVIGTNADIFAQSPVASSTPSCPIVRVSCPDTVNANQPLTMTADVSGGDANIIPTYNWTVSAGTISSGQGTSSITIDTTGLSGNSTVTATVDVGGYNRSCPASNSCTSSITAKIEARKFDEFGKIRTEDEKARLDNLSLELQNDPLTQGYIISYGGRQGKKDEAQKTADRAKNYLVKTRKIENARLVTLNGGYRETLMTELWIVPRGATPPDASPNVDPSEVAIIKAKSKKKPAKSKTKKGKKS